MKEEKVVIRFRASHSLPSSSMLSDWAVSMYSDVIFTCLLAWEEGKLKIGKQVESLRSYHAIVLLEFSSICTSYLCSVYFYATKGQAL